MTEPQADSLANPLLIDAAIAPKLSFAAQQNDVPALRDLTLLNTGEREIADLVLRVEADPPVFAPREWRFDRIAPGGATSVSKRDLPLNAGLLLGLAEAVRAEVSLRAHWPDPRSPDGIARAERRFPVELLARNEWGGAGSMPELLAAFVLPNDPACARLLKAASGILRDAGRPDGIDGYQAKSRARAYELVSAIWSASCALGLSYAEPPASFERAGQKLRTPTEIVAGGLATCLDTALLFAGACELAGLYPVLVLTEGHACAGAWLQPQEFATLLVRDPGALRKRAALDEMVVFETTLATGGAPAGFAAAIAAGNRQLAEEREERFVLAVDVRRARMQRIRPLPLGAPAEPPAIADAPAPAAPALAPAPALPAFDPPEPDIPPGGPDADPGPDPGDARGRMRRWQRKLLDLSTRNQLLATRPGAGAIPLFCPDPARLEDLLAGGRGFRLVAAPEFTQASGRDAALHTERTGTDPDAAHAAAALERGELIVPAEPEALEARLTELYRKTRLDLAEGGANTLFLAIGFLSWRKAANGPAYRAPLILLPARLERRSVRSGMVLRAHEDEPRFNLTLLQMLRQDFELDIAGLDGALPTDGAGIDVSGIWNAVRRAVRDMAGFEVAPEVMLGAFSFAKYLMWKDLAERTEQIGAHPIVRHLLETPREPYPVAARAPAPEALDAELAPADTYAPLPADSSQLAAVLAAARGCDFVLDGPPGTGKSQTIANAIAQNLAIGRTILFVSEKRAALEVVHRRLVANGLGPFCLELHSSKTSRQSVLRQLEAAWATRGELDAAADPDPAWRREAEALRRERDALNAHAAALHRRHPNMLTLHEAIGRVVRDQLEGGPDRQANGRAAPALDWPHADPPDQAALTAMREATTRLDRLLPPAGDRRIFAAIGHAEWSNAWQAALLAAAAALGRTAEALGAAGERLVAWTGLPPRPDQRGLEAAAALARAIDRSGGIDLGFALEPGLARAVARTRAALRDLAAYRAQKAALAGAYADEAIATLPLDQLEADWRAAEAAIWPFGLARRRTVARQLPPGADPATDLPRLRALRTLLGALDQAGAPGWAGLRTDPAAAEATLAAAETLDRAVIAVADQPERLASLRAALSRMLGDGAAVAAARAFAEAHAAFAAALAAFEQAAEPPAPFDPPDLFAFAREMASALPARAARLPDWAAWLRARRTAQALRLDALVAAAEAGGPEGGAAAAFELAHARWWAEGAIDAEPAVRDFTLAEHRAAIERFRALDARMAAASREVIRTRLARRIPAPDAKAPPGFGLLAQQLKLQKRHMPVRQLLAEIGSALPALAPCLLMSPLSVAQYLPPDLAPFDLVIFDEASQIAPWDAVGAIARGRQLVVAGDPRQMPPTSFFARGPGAEADDDELEPDQESILDACLAARLPRRALSWHYRSRHESLIAFSNYRYYDNALVTFPGPATRDAAVSLRIVPGAWARGRARTNPIEARAIADEVLARLADPGFLDENGARPSLMVITLNAEQQKLIEDLLDQARRARPELEPHFAEGAAEPVAVKNLETVQGDERDLVLLGIGFGPETPGAPTMAMNFGPLNRDGGWRRLNVALTRARREMVVFASFAPELIDLNRTGAEAVRDLKHFMRFAQCGPRALAEAVSGSLGGFESPFEAAVAEGLRARGWQAAPQVGVSRFRIDLGIVHPDQPGEYLAGVECDGATYHAATTARDRDKAREAVLAQLGWRLERVWSTDWWRDPVAALDRLDTRLRAILAQSRETRAQAPAEAPAPPCADQPTGEPAPEPAELETGPQAEPEPEPQTTVPPPPGAYRRTDFADMAARLDPGRFQEPGYAAILREMAERVIATEAPIRDTVLVERIARAHGFRRSGGRITDRVLSIARAVAHAQAEPDGEIFLWPDPAAICAWDATPPWGWPPPGLWPDPAAICAWDRARPPADPTDRRAAEEIALPELAAALRACAAGADADQTELEASAARLLGLRPGPAVRRRLRLARPATGHLNEDAGEDRPPA